MSRQVVSRKGPFRKIGQRFIANPRASLFGLRSYWTGFDAPGEDGLHGVFLAVGCAVAVFAGPEILRPFASY